MAKPIYTLGLSKIEVGDIAEDGDMGTNLAALGYTAEDSCTFEQDDPSDTEFYAEEVDDPVVIISKNGKINMGFDIMNPSLEVLKDLFGGTIDTAAGTWSAPDKILSIEKSVKITPDQGFIYKIPRMKLTPKIVGGFSKTGMGKITIKGVVLQPSKANVSKLTFEEKK